MTRDVPSAVEDASNEHFDLEGSVIEERELFRLDVFAVNHASLDISVITTIRLSRTTEGNTVALC